MREGPNLRIAIQLRGQHGDPMREPQGECFGPANPFRDCSNRLLGCDETLQLTQTTILVLLYFV